MKPINKYFSNWSVTRIVRLVMSVVLGFGFSSTKEPAYLVLSVMLGMQAAFNISCPGRRCATTPAKVEKPAVKFNQYKSKTTNNV